VQDRYRSNEPRFVDETIGGEALIMDMVRGSYYSCVGASASVWNALKGGATGTEVAEQMAALGVERRRVDDDLAVFVAALLADELLVPRGDGVAGEPVLLEELGWPAEYAGLELERYTDLADLILLDPVHDVSEDGWPRTAE
jgi:hypothetical protein